MYNVGGDSERTNLEVIHSICDLVDAFFSEQYVKPASDNITFVKDRPGHDRRYAIDASKIKNEIGWKPAVDFEEGLRRTVEWYLLPNPWLTLVSGGKFHRKRIGNI